MSEVTVLDERRKFFTIASLADYLDVSERYVRTLVNGTSETPPEIPSYMFGKARRIDPRDVDVWLERRRDAA